MQEARSIQFEVKRWQFNDKVVIKNLRTTADLFTYALRNSDDGGATVAGVALRWHLNIYTNDVEVIHFMAEDMIAVPDKNITDNEFEKLIRQSYIMAYGEAASRNMNVGFNTSFPPFEQMNINIIDVKQVLYK